MVKIQERKILTQEQVRYFFDYQNGQLLWKNILKFSHVKIGQIAGGITDDKRCIIGLYGTTFYASRLIFCWHHGLYA